MKIVKESIKHLKPRSEEEIEQSLDPEIFKAYKELKKLNIDIQIESDNYMVINKFYAKYIPEEEKDYGGRGYSKGCWGWCIPSMHRNIFEGKPGKLEDFLKKLKELINI